VTIATITRVSGGRITLDADGLSYYAALAIEALALDAPDLGGASYDRAEALLICHMAAADLAGDLEMKSENRGGDWSYSKDAGQTSYLVQYRALLAQFAVAAIADEGVIREDARMTGLALDEVLPPIFTSLERSGS
jgi:hypothetical protein